MGVNRRDALKGLLACSSVAVVQATPTKLLAGEPVSKIDMAEAALKGMSTSPSLKQIGCAANEVVERETEAIIRYRRAVRREVDKRARDAGEEPEVVGVSAISIPYATYPLNVYMRTTEAQLAIPEPEIPNTHASMLGGWGAWQIMAMIELYSEKMKLIPPGIEVLQQTEDFTIMDPIGKKPAMRDRVVSPRYVVDIDEPHFGMRMTANMIADAAEGIWKEWRDKIAAAYAAVKEMGPFWKVGRSIPKSTSIAKQGQLLLRVAQQVQVRHIQVKLERDAYMLEFFCWNTGAGWAKPVA